MAYSLALRCGLNLILILTVLTVQTAGQSNAVGPQSLTLRVGAPSAVFTCSGDPSDSVQWTMWNPTPVLIFDTANGLVATNKDKYWVNGTGVNGTGGSGSSQSMLTVRNLALEDGVAYSCERTTTNRLYANLVVIDRPQGSVTSSSSSSSSTSGLNVGDQVMLTCQVVYGAPSIDQNFPGSNLTPQQTPELMVGLGGQDLTRMAAITFEQGQPGMMHRLTVKVNNYTVRQEDAGNPLVCQVLTQNPQYTDSTNSMLNIKAMTSNVTIYFEGSELYIGESVNCSANGYPLPTVSWMPFTDQPWQNMSNYRVEGSSGQGSATLTPREPGYFKWNCTATQNNGGQTVSKAISFRVSVNGSIPQESKGPDSIGIGLGVGLGVGVPVLLGIIILVIVLMKRRKSTKSPPAYSVTEADKSKKTTSTTQAKPAKTTTNNEPVRGKRPEPQPPKNGPTPIVNSHPNPGYVTDSTTEGLPKSRDSPGYGDLGVKQMSGSGSIPQLNDSFDSNANRSFDQGGRQVQPNGPPQNGTRPPPHTDV